MSIEQQIAENTEALKALTAAIRELTATMGAPAAKPASQPKEAAAKVAPAKQEPAEAQPAAAAAAPEGADANPVAAEAEPALDYEDIKKPFLALVAAKGREAGLAVLRDLGVPDGGTLKALAPEQYADALKVIKKAAA